MQPSWNPYEAVVEPYKLLQNPHQARAIGLRVCWAWFEDAGSMSSGRATAKRVESRV